MLDDDKKKKQPAQPSGPKVVTATGRFGTKVSYSPDRVAEKHGAKVAEIVKQSVRKLKNPTTTTIRKPNRSWMNKRGNEMSLPERAAFSRIHANTPGFDVNGFRQSLAQEIRLPGDPLYNPYFDNKSNQKEAMEFFGVDRFDREWLDANVGLRQYVNRLDVTDSISTAGKKNWTPEQWAGYYYENLLIDEEETQKAEAQWKQLRDDAADFFATRRMVNGSDPSLEDFLASVDISNYSVLQKMDESRNIGSAGSSKVVRLNRPVGYSRENLVGLYRSLSNGTYTDDSDLFEESVQYYMDADRPPQQKPQPKYGWESTFAAMTPEQRQAEEKRIRTSGNREEMVRWNYLDWQATTGKTGSYFQGEYIDDAFFERYEPIAGLILEQMSEYDATGKLIVRSPGKNAPESEKMAYEYYKIKKNEPDTRILESEWGSFLSAVMREADLAKEGDYDFASHMRGADGESGKLKDLLDNRTDLVRYLRDPNDYDLNRPVYASWDAVNRVIELAGKGVDVSGFERDPMMIAEPVEVQGPQMTHSPDDTVQAADGDSPVESVPTESAHKSIPPTKILTDPELAEKRRTALDEKGVSSYPMEDTTEPTSSEKTSTALTGNSKDGGTGFLDGLLTKAGESYSLKTGLPDTEPVEVQSDFLPMPDIDSDLMGVAASAGLLSKEDALLVAPKSLYDMDGDQVTRWIGYLDEAKETLTGAYNLPTEDTYNAIQSKIWELEAEIQQRSQDVFIAGDGDGKIAAEIDVKNAQIAELIEVRTQAQNIEIAKGAVDDFLTEGQRPIWTRGSWWGGIGNNLPGQPGWFERMERGEQEQREYYAREAEDDAKLKEAVGNLMNGGDPAKSQSIFDEFAQRNADWIAGIGERADAWVDHTLGTSVPDWVRFASKGIITNAGAATTAASQFYTDMVPDTFKTLGNLYGYAMSSHYKAVLGERYTIDGARALDPALDGFYRMAEATGGLLGAGTADYASAGYGAQYTDMIVGNTLRIATFNKIGGAIGKITGPLLEKTLPFIDKWPSVLGHMGRAVGKSAEWMIRKMPYSIDAYNRYVAEARNRGHSEDQAAAYGLYGASTQGVIEGALGSAYESVAGAVPNAIGSLAQKIALGGGNAILSKGGNIIAALGKVISLAAGEAMEEGTEVISEDVGRSWLLGEDVDFRPWGELVRDLSTGFGRIDTGKYVGTRVEDAMNNAKAGFISSLGTTILFGLSGMGGKDYQARSEAISEKAQSDPNFGKHVQEALEIIASDASVEQNPIEKSKPSAQSFDASTDQDINAKSSKAPLMVLDPDTGDMVPVPDSADPEVAAATQEPESFAVRQLDKAFDEAKEKTADAFDEAKEKTSKAFDEASEVDDAPPIKHSPEAQQIARFVTDGRDQLNEAVIAEVADQLVEQAIENDEVEDVMAPESTESRNITRIATDIGLIADQIEQYRADEKAQDDGMQRAILAGLDIGLSYDSGKLKQTIHNFNEAKSAIARKRAALEQKQTEMEAELKNAEEHRRLKSEKEKNRLRMEREAEARKLIEDGNMQDANYISNMSAPGIDRFGTTESYLDAITKRDDPRYESNKSVQGKERQDRFPAQSSVDDNFDESLEWTPPNQLVEVDAKTYHELMQAEYADLNEASQVARYNLDMRGVVDTLKFPEPDYVGGERDSIAALNDDNYSEVGRNDVYVIVEDKGNSAERVSELTETLSLLRSQYDESRPDEADSDADSLHEKMLRVQREIDELNRFEDFKARFEQYKRDAIQANKDGDRYRALALAKGASELKQNLDSKHGRYLAINLTTAPDHRDQAIEFRSDNLDKVLDYANRSPETSGAYSARQRGRKRYRVAEEVLWKHRPNLANDLVHRGGMRSFDDYVADVKKSIYNDSENDSLTDDEKQEMLDKYTFKSRMSQHDRSMVDIDRNDDFVLIVKSSDYPGKKEDVDRNGNSTPVNKDLLTVDDALAVVKACIDAQDIHRRNGPGASKQYHDPAFKAPKTSLTVANTGGKKEGRHYFLDGAIKYTTMTPDGRWETLNIGEWDGSENDRRFVPYNDLLAIARIIHVNYYFTPPGGVKSRYTFSLEVNRQQGSNRPVFDMDAPLSSMTPQQDIENRFERALSAVMSYDDGGVLRDSPDKRTRLLKELTLAGIGSVEADMQRALATKDDPNSLARFAYRREQLDTMQSLLDAQADRSGGNQASNRLAERLRSYLWYSGFNNSASRTIESRITYEGQDQDLANLQNLADQFMSAQKSVPVDTVKLNALYGEIVRLARSSMRKLVNERNVRGGGLLLAEYDERLDYLDARIKAIRKDAGGSLDYKGKAPILKLLLAERKEVYGKFMNMRKAGITLSTPSKLDTIDSTPKTQGRELVSDEDMFDPSQGTTEPLEVEETSTALTENGKSDGAEDSQPKTVEEIMLSDTRMASEIVDDAMAAPVEEAPTPPRIKVPKPPVPTGSELQDRINQQNYEAEMARLGPAIRDQAWRDKTRSGVTLNSPEDTAPVVGEEPPELPPPVKKELPNPMIDPATYELPKLPTLDELKQASAVLDETDRMIKLFTRNIDELAGKGELDEEETRRLETMIANRQEYKRSRDAIAKRIGEPGNQEVIKRAQIVDDAVRTGLSTSTVPHMRNAAIDEGVASNKIWLDQNKDIMRDGKLTALSDDEVLGWMDHGSTEEKLLENLETANDISRFVHGMEDRLELVQDGITKAQSELGLLAKGTDDTEIQARLGRLLAQRDSLLSQIENGKESAKGYYIDSAPGLRSVLKAQNGGKLPVSVINKVIAIAKEASGTKKTMNPAHILVSNFGNAKQVFESRFGDYAPIMTKLYIQPVLDANNEIRKGREAFNERINASGITNDNSEIAHQYAEHVIGPDELKKQRPNDWQDIVKGVRVYREAYDELLEQINVALMKNGYDPVPKRENYFPHRMEDASKLDVILGKDVDEFTLKTSLFGLTPEFKPGKPFNPHFLERKGEKTVYDLRGGYDRYIEGALNVIYQTDNIRRLRQLEEELRAAFDIDENNFTKTRMGNFTQWLMHYTNHVAGKKDPIDYAAESKLKRGAYTALTFLRSQRGSALVMGNLSVAVSNALPVGQVLGFEPVGTMRAMGEVFGGWSTGNPSQFDPYRISERSAFISRRYNGKPLDLSWVDKFSETANVPIEMVDRIASDIVVRAIYYQGVRRGYTDEVALSRADDIAYRMMANRARGESGSLQSSLVGGTVLQFAREPINNLMFMLKDQKELNGALPAAVAAIVMFLFNWGFNKVTGKETALDPIGAGEKTAKGAMNAIEEGEDVNPLDVAGDLGKNLWATGWPVNESNPTISGFKNVGDAASAMLSDPTNPVSWEKVISAGLGWTPGGAQIERMARGAKTIWRGYSDSKEGYYRFAFDNPSPIDIVTVMALGEGSTSQGKAFRDAGGKPMGKAQDADTKGQIASGITPSEAEGNVRGTADAKKTQTSATDAHLRGSLSEGYKLEDEARAARKGITVPSGTPSWALEARDEPYMKKAYNWWQKYGETAILPKSIPDVLDDDKRRVDVKSEDRADLEARYARYYRSAVEGLPEDASLAEIKKAIQNAYNLAKSAYVTMNYAGKSPR